MFFLRLSNSDHKSIFLHVRGFSDPTGSGLVDNEGIFLAEKAVNPQNPNLVELQIIRRVGTVHAGTSGLSFSYTDNDFKRSIHYQEKTGYSGLDGASWMIMKANYGPEQGTLDPRNPGLYMYASANNPMLRIAPTQRFFQAAAPEGHDEQVNNLLLKN